MPRATRKSRGRPKEPRRRDDGARTRGKSQTGGELRASLAIEEREGARRKIAKTSLRIRTGVQNASRPRSTARFTEFQGLSQILSALGHAARLRILRLLLDGPGTYRALQRVTQCKAGPLYHHLGQLRLAGLILPKQRDLYVLSGHGRKVVLSVLLISKMSAV